MAADGDTTKSKTFCSNHYKLVEYSTTQYNSSVRNILARFKSLVIHAINEKKFLPKAIIFVPDDDIIKQSCLTKEDARNGDFTIIAKYLLEEIQQLIVGYKAKLPTKCKNDIDPHMIWILLPAHKNIVNNIIREYFNQA